MKKTILSISFFTFFIQLNAQCNLIQNGHFVCDQLSANTATPNYVIDAFGLNLVDFWYRVATSQNTPDIHLANGDLSLSPYHCAHLASTNFPINNTGISEIIGQTLGTPIVNGNKYVLSFMYRTNNNTLINNLKVHLGGRSPSIEIFDALLLPSSTYLTYSS